MTVPSTPGDDAADRAALGADAARSLGDGREADDAGLLERVARAMRRLWGEPSEEV